MKKGKLNETIFSKDYYRMEKLVRDQRFKERVQWLRGEYTRLNHPIPQKGFKDYKQYAQWVKVFGKFYHETNKSKLKKRKMPIILNTPSGWEKVIEIHEEERKILPLVPNFFIENIMEEFGINKDNHKLFSFILWHVFLGKEHLEETPIKMTIRRNDKSEWEMALIILPHTTLDHVIAFWGNVVKKQNYLAGYQGKNKKRISFERDLHIFEIYKKFESQRIGKRSSFRTLADLTQSEIEKEGTPGYIGLTHSLIRKAVTRIKELDEDPAKRPSLTGAHANLIIGKK